MPDKPFALHGKLNTARSDVSTILSKRVDDTVGGGTSTKEHHLFEFEFTVI